MCVHHSRVSAVQLPVAADGPLLNPCVRQPKGPPMDTWKFYDITHHDHVVCNPTSEEKLARLVGLLRLSPDARVVDIACGKGEFLVRLAEAYGIRGTGIDLSPFCVADARKRLQARAPGAA